MVTANTTPAQPENDEKVEKLLDYWSQIAQAFPEGSNEVTDQALYDLFFEIYNLKENRGE